MRTSAAILLSAVAVVSCRGDVTGTAAPSEPMTVTFEPATFVRTGTRFSNGFLQCPVDLTILAHGKTDHLVELQSVTLAFSDSTGPRGAPTVASAVSWFGVGYLRRDDTAVAHRLPAAEFPFSLSGSLAYTDQFGTAKVAAFALKCTD